MLTKNQRAEVLIETGTQDGYGICRLDGRAVFVSGAIAGERWEILILKLTNTAVWAKGLRLIQASPERCEPACHSLCGGCSLQHMSYEEELRVKKAHVDDCLMRIGDLPHGTTAIHPSGMTERYRNKAIFAVERVGEKTEYGFYRPRSHDLVPVADCRLQSEECNLAARVFVQLMDRFGILPYDEKSGKGCVRNLFWRESRLGDRVLCIIAARGFGSLTKSLVNELRAACPFLTGIVLNINKMRGNTLLAGDFYTLWGSPTVREKLCGNQFEIATQAFLQINPPQAENVYEKAFQFAVGSDHEDSEHHQKTLALDLYCGAGTMTLCLAKGFARVIGAEIVPEAIENARANAVQNGVKNVDFICADASEAAAHLLRENNRPDAVVVDPPRKGLAESVVRDIAGMRPERIVYISCNPATLARDLKRFSEAGYVIQRAEAYDMFPRTGHVETVCLLVREKV